MSSDSPSNTTDAINALRYELAERLTEPLVTAITEALELHGEEQARAQILAALIAGGHIGPISWNQASDEAEAQAARARKLVDRLLSVVKVIP